MSRCPECGKSLTTSPRETELIEALAERGISAQHQYCMRYNRNQYTHSDLFVPSANLLIEVDGFEHLNPVRALSDHWRDNYAKKAGYDTLRFSNSAVDNNVGAVCNKIERWIGGRENSAPLPQPLGFWLFARILCIGLICILALSALLHFISVPQLNAAVSADSAQTVQNSAVIKTLQEYDSQLAQSRGELDAIGAQLNAGKSDSEVLTRIRLFTNYAQKYRALEEQTRKYAEFVDANKFIISTTNVLEVEASAQESLDAYRKNIQSMQDDAARFISSLNTPPEQVQQLTVFLISARNITNYVPIYDGPVQRAKKRKVINELHEYDSRLSQLRGELDAIGLRLSNERSNSPELSTVMSLFTDYARKYARLEEQTVKYGEFVNASNFITSVTNVLEVEASAREALSNYRKNLQLMQDDAARFVTSLNMLPAQVQQVSDFLILARDITNYAPANSDTPQIAQEIVVITETPLPTSYSAQDVQACAPIDTINEYEPQLNLLRGEMNSISLQLSESSNLSVLIPLLKSYVQKYQVLEEQTLEYIKLITNNTDLCNSATIQQVVESALAPLNHHMGNIQIRYADAERALLLPDIPQEQAQQLNEFLALTREVIGVK